MRGLSNIGSGIGFVLAAALLSSCAITPKTTTEMATKSDAKNEETTKKKKLEETKRSLEIAKMKLEVAKMSQKSEEIEQDVALTKARSERDLAERQMRQFTEIDMPRRLEEGRLHLQEGKDGLQDAKEELAQLEDMYKDGDLADKTREIVLNRGRRRVERTTKWLSLQEIELRSLETFHLPVEKEKLTLSLTEKKEALAKAERDTAKSKAERAIGTREAENEVTKQESEVAEASATKPQ